MKNQVAEQLFDLNAQFYQLFGRAFAETRRRIQPGVRRVLQEWVTDGDWVDLGSGSGVLALEWAKSGLHGSYLGIDFSQPMLEEARSSLEGFSLPPDLDVRFEYADLRCSSWVSLMGGRAADGALMFAVLHHIPGSEHRLHILQTLHEVLKPGASLIHSEWQFQNSPRLVARIQPWNLVGIDPADVEQGDTLLDWRHALTGQTEHRGLRYVHQFSREELTHLAEASGFEIEQEFESDGAGEQLGLYQLWRRV